MPLNRAAEPVMTADDGLKRSLPAAAASAAPAARRQKAAAAANTPADERTTTATLFEFDHRWAGPVKEMYKDRELHDVVLSAGGARVAAHRVILAAASPHLRTLFGCEMADSREVALQVDSRALEKIVDFAYTGEIELARSTVVAIIQAANLLQVTAVEAAAVEFLADRLDPRNCFTAMALGLHMSESAAGRELHDRSVAFMCESFGPVVSDPAFLAAEAEAVASLIDRDDVDAAEEKVFGAVVRWVQADEGARVGELDRLLPLVRFPMMESTGGAAAEPLFAEHRLCAELLAECGAAFEAAAECARLRPRVGRRRPGSFPEWMDTTDGFAGFKKLHYFPNVALAVSKTGKLEAGKVYDAPAGWHWGSKAEVAAIMGGGEEDIWRPPLRYYHAQGGWNGCTWGGVRRIFFVFSDSLQVSSRASARHSSSP